VFRRLFSCLVEPPVIDVPIPEDLSDIPVDEYATPDEGDQGHQDQLTREIEEMNRGL
jgi:hypothetical protein